MFTSRKSFLMFYVLFLIWGTVVFSQKKQDSLSFYYNLALNPNKSSDFGEAYDYFIAHKVDCLKNKNTEGAIYDLRLLAIIQNESGFYYDSESSAIEALTLLDKMPDNAYTQEAKLGLYNELGRVSRALKEPDRALMYYNKALEISTQQKNQNRIINNRGFIYLDELQFDNALTEFETAYRISVDINDHREAARNLANIGYVKYKMGQTDALTHMESALEKRIALDDLEGTYASYTHFFEYYDTQGDAQNAELYLNKSLAIANTLNSDAYRFDVLSKYINISTDSLIVAYKVLNDKIRLDNMLTENKYASRKYDYSQKESEAQSNKNLKERWQIAILVVLILVLFSYFLIRMNHKKDNMHQVFQTEIRISKKIHDELANDVSDLMNYVENDLNTSSESKIKLLNSLEDVYVRTRDISTETAGVDFENFAQSLKYLLIQHNKTDVKVIINDINTINWENLSDHKKLAVYRVLQELMVNMKKHSQAHLVSVIFKKNKKKNEIWYADDGKGSLNEYLSANGLKNAESRIKEIGGRLTFETSEGHGFKAFIIFS